MVHAAGAQPREAAMRVQKFLLIGVAMAGVAVPTWGRDPADPSAPVPPARYAPVISGTKSYRPVEPVPWGNVNRSVAPPETGKPLPEPKRKNPGQHDQH
jgi:hypothetical protein